MEHVKALCTDWECSVCKQAPSAPEAMSVVAEQNAAILLQELSKALARVKELEGKAGFVDFKAAYQMMQKERDAVLAELARMREALELIADMPCDSDERQIARKALSGTNGSER